MLSISSVFKGRYGFCMHYLQGAYIRLWLLVRLQSIRPPGYMERATTTSAVLKYMQGGWEGGLGADRSLPQLGPHVVVWMQWDQIEIRSIPLSPWRFTLCFSRFFFKNETSMNTECSPLQIVIPTCEGWLELWWGEVELAHSSLCLPSCDYHTQWQMPTLLFPWCDFSTWQQNAWIWLLFAGQVVSVHLRNCVRHWDNVSVPCHLRWWTLEKWGKPCSLVKLWR